MYNLVILTIPDPRELWDEKHFATMIEYENIEEAKKKAEKWASEQVYFIHEDAIQELTIGDGSHAKLIRNPPFIPNVWVWEK